METRQILAAIAILVAAIGTFAWSKATLKSRRGVDNMGNRIMYPITRGHIVRYIAMAVAVCVIIGDVGASAASLINTLHNSADQETSNDFLAESENPDSIPEPTDEPEIEVAVGTAAHEAITLTQEQLDLLTAGHTWYLSRNSMPSNSRFRKLLAGGDFSGAVSFTLKMAVSGTWFDEMHGISLTNPEAKAYTPEQIEALLVEKIKEWTEEYKDLPADEFYRALLWRIYDEILRNPVFGDMVNQFMADHEYFTKNNDWVDKLRKVFNWAYEQPNGIFSLYEYEEGWDSAMIGASAHIVPKKNIQIDGEEYSYRELLQLTCAMFDDVVVLGICENMLPAESWYIPSDSIEADFVRTVKQEIEKGSAKGRSVLLLAFKDKYGNVAVLFGFNMEDSRLEVFKPETPVTIQETPEPTSTPEPTPEPTPTPKPDPTAYEATRRCVDEQGNLLRSDSLGNHKDGTILTASQIGKPDIPGYTYKSGLTDLKVTANGNNVITLVYSKNPGPTPETYAATRKCVDKAGNELRSDGLGSYEAGTVLKASQIGKPDIPGYTYESGLADLPIKADGDNVITLVYAKDPGPTPDPTYYEATRRCVDENNNELRSDSLGKHADGTTLTANQIGKPDIPGYTYKSGLGSLTVSANGDNTITLVYGKNPDPTYEGTRVCVDEAGNQLRSDSLGAHKAGTKLTTAQIGKPDIPGYTYKSGLTDLTISATGSNVVTLVYTKNPDPTYEGTRICVDEAGNQLRSDSLGSHKAGTALTASQVGKPDIPGYTYKSGLTGLTISADGNNTVTLVYAKNPDPTYNATRRCVDEAGNELRSDGLGSHKAGTVLTASQIGKPDISGYTYKSGLADLTISATGNNTITLVYSKNPDPTYEATRICVDEQGNQLRSDSLGSHKAGTVLTASQIGKPDISGYTYKSGLGDLTISAGGSNTITLVYSKNGDGNGDKTPGAGTSQNGEGDKGGGDNGDNNGGHDDGSYQDYDKEKEDAEKAAQEAAEAEKRRQEEEERKRKEEEERKKQEEEAAKKEQENAENQGEGNGLTTENGEEPDVSDEEIPVPDTDWEETSTNPDGSTTSTTTNATTGEQTVETTTTDGEGNVTTESSTAQTDPDEDTTGEIEEPPVDDD